MIIHFISILSIKKHPDVFAAPDYQSLYLILYNALLFLFTTHLKLKWSMVISGIENGKLGKFAKLGNNHYSI